MDILLWLLMGFVAWIIVFAIDSYFRLTRIEHDLNTEPDLEFYKREVSEAIKGHFPIMLFMTFGGPVTLIVLAIAAVSFGIVQLFEKINESFIQDTRQKLVDYFAKKLMLYKKRKHLNDHPEEYL